MWRSGVNLSTTAATVDVRSVRKTLYAISLIKCKLQGARKKWSVLVYYRLCPLHCGRESIQEVLEPRLDTWATSFSAWLLVSSE